MAKKLIVLGPTKQPLCRPIGKGWSETVEVAVYDFVYDQVQYRIHIPFRFKFDGASIPRLVWSILGLTPHGDMDGPALPHDLAFLYRGRFPAGVLFCIIEGKEVHCGDILPKGVWDLLFRELIIWFDAAPKWKAYACYAGVKTFGWAAWLRDDKKRKAELLEGVV